ncbi:acyl-CoA carboxylase subunit beta [Phaeobacter gallaeciensis]|uniref:Acyl-CoA carboxylase subunit beta n=1 Tax=Phaeobacter gallaeciensis TaxID=60890 RepID=A0A366X7H5_9RHOB|nr:MULTISPECIES: carboxyl transferase domain-containing protein [Roseobacteraceae]MBT8167539.1 acyl-CoA carboxylase subunit beta [Falsiruegeria litorea]RBW57925.1 acyl-CoA carboxylase subunit beta [Phaeobacter gallaeciensis]
MGFVSQVVRESETFAKNRAGMLDLVAEMRALEARPVALSEQRRERMEARGQITPRDRLAHLLDPGMPFLQIHGLAGYLVDSKDPEKSVPGASVIIGIGFVSGVRCMIVVDDAGIKAGSMVEMTGAAVLSAQDMALKQNLPFVHLVESAGANLMEYKVEFWANGGKLFRNLARHSAAGLPNVAVLHGPSTAGGAYMPGLADYVVGVKNNGMAALAGAALTHAATGERANDRDLGGSEMHATISGLVEYLAEDDTHGVEMARDVMARLDWNKSLPVRHEKHVEPPRYDAEEIAGVVPTDYRMPYDMREVVARLVDGSEFEDFKPGYGPATVCLQAAINGISVGIIGNNGPLDPAGANKATQFIQLCGQSDTPLIFLNNITGFMVGTQSEQGGMIKHGAKMIQAVTSVDVPKIALYIGASFGAGNYGMCGYAYDPDFLFAWPNAATGVMGGEQAAGTMEMVARAGFKRKGVEPDEAKMAAQTAAITHHFTRQEGAFYTSGRCIDHGVIDPRDTRRVLGFCLETCLEGRARKVKPTSYGVHRF